MEIDHHHRNNTSKFARDGTVELSIYRNILYYANRQFAPHSYGLPDEFFAMIAFWAFFFTDCRWMVWEFIIFIYVGLSLLGIYSYFHPNEQRT